MLSGRRLDLLDPSPGDIAIEDIAHGLARVARWNGQTHGPHALSVAQHSLLVEAIVRHLSPATERSRPLLLTALLHDAPEYVVGDLISPFKAAIGDDYKAVERRIFAAVLVRFDLPSPPNAAHLEAIKSADRISAYYEARGVAGFSPDEALAIFRAPPDLPSELRRQLEKLTPLDSESAGRAFMERFEALNRHI